MSYFLRFLLVLLLIGEAPVQHQTADRLNTAADSTFSPHTDHHQQQEFAHLSVSCLLTFDNFLTPVAGDNDDSALYKYIEPNN